MRIGIIGAGNMGSAFARRLSAAGHDVFIASRDPNDAKEVATDSGHNVRAVPQGQLADNADVIVAATPYPQQLDAVRSTGTLDGKTLVEISNPMTADMSGLAVGHTTSAAEEVASAAPRANVVKAFNTIFAQVLASQPDGSRGAQVFYAGDDDTAKSNVRSLIESLGFEPVDAGPLRNARYLEPLGMLNIYFGYVAKLGTDIAPTMRKVTGREAGASAAAAGRPERETRAEGR